MQTANTEGVAYGKLCLAPNAINARDANSDAYSDASIGELAALIKAAGLIQPIVARPAKKGMHEVYAGKRRYLAIGKLIATNEWPADEPVPVVIRDEDDAAAKETSLMENIGRRQMHPVDEYEVFAELFTKGSKEDEIATRYGVEVRVVRQRLALGNLTVDARAAWRAGKVTETVAKMMARLSKKEQQALVKDGRRVEEWSVRNLLKGGDKPKLSDPRVRFVGLDAYAAAGGKYVADLFDGDGYIENPEILTDLVAARMEQRCQELVAAGWKWAKPATEFKALWQLKRSQPKIEHTEDEEKSLTNLRAAMDKLGEDAQFNDETGAYAHLEAQVEDIEDAAKARGFTARQMAKSGCVLKVTEQKLEIEYGVILPADERKPAAKDGDDDGAGLGLANPAAPRAGGADGMSNALMQSLTEWQTMAAAEVLATSPAEVVLRLVLATFTASEQGPVRLSASGYSGVARESGRMQNFEKAHTKLAGLDLPAMLAQFGLVVASSLDLRRFSHSSMRSPTSEPSTLSLVSVLDATDYHRVMCKSIDYESFFNRSSASVAIDAIKEMGGAAKPGSKKADLVTAATANATDCGWLPKVLRHPEYKLTRKIGDPVPASAAGKKRGAR